jgi:hypothetical protein
MTKKSKAQENEQLPDSLSMGTSKTPASKSCTAMTSCDYRLLRQGEPNEKQIAAYIHFTDKFTSRDTLERELQSTTGSEPQDYLKAIERSDATFYQTVWQGRRELVAKMNLPTLVQLAKRYGIPTGSESIREHPDASDLDKGLLLARLRQFLVWDGEYHGTAPEMLDIEVEAALVAAQTRTKGWQLSDTEILEPALRHASASNKANDTMLVTALKECIAITCVCPALDRGFPLKTESLEERIMYLVEQINELGDTEDDADSRDKDLEQAKASLKKIKKRQRTTATALREVCAYQKEFTPGKAMPQIVMDATDKWFTAQFAEGKPVGSIVRVAWLADTFHKFWKQHQSAYLALDPGQRETQKKAAAHGKRGAETKADKKWRSFTSQFVEYISNSPALPNKLSPEQIRSLVDAFGHHLMDQNTRGASEKRTVAKIKEFISTLVILMNRNADEDEVQSTWKRLSSGAVDQRKEKVSGGSYYDDPPIPAKRGGREGTQNFSTSADDTSTHVDKKLRGNKGKFRKGAFSSFPLETFKGCLEILRGALKRRKTLPGTRGRPQAGAAKKI